MGSTVQCTPKEYMHTSLLTAPRSQRNTLMPSTSVITNAVDTSAQQLHIVLICKDLSVLVWFSAEALDLKWELKP